MAQIDQKKNAQRLKQALEWIEQQDQTMQQLLCQWVEINSHTFNLPGLEKMRTALASAFSELNANAQIVHVEPYQSMNARGGSVSQALGHCYYLKSVQQGTKKVLLCGHMDTVYPEDSAFQHIQWMSRTQLRGPGVSDMKSGLVIMLYSLLALQKYHLNPDIAWQVFINADEEIGSPGSTPWIKQYAQQSDIGLVFEPALNAQGTLVSERKGSAKYIITAQGKSAHAGRTIVSGRNAIVALAQGIGHIVEFNNGCPGLTVNIGKINGGEAANVVPDFALCQVDVRYEKMADLTWVEKNINETLKRITQKTQVKFHCYQQNKRCPKAWTSMTEALFHLAAECANELKISLTWEKSGGCCDGNTMAMAGIPVIDTLGGCGKNIHSPQEILEISSLVERTQLTTLLLARLV